MERTISIQKARKKYEEKFFKITVRVDKDFERKFAFLVKQQGGQKEAIEYALNHAYVGNRLLKNNILNLEIEKNDLAEKNEQLKKECEDLKALIASKAPQENHELATEIFFQDLEDRLSHGYLESFGDELDIEID